jgi:hypothetical protein
MYEKPPCRMAGRFFVKKKKKGRDIRGRYIISVPAFSSAGRQRSNGLR